MCGGQLARLDLSHHLVLRLATKFGEAKSDWSGYRSYLETRELFLIFLADNPRFFLFVPKRAFDSAQELDDFRQILAVNLEQSRSATEKRRWLDRNRWKIVDYGVSTIIFLVIIVVTYFIATHLSK